MAAGVQSRAGAVIVIAPCSNSDPSRGRSYPRPQQQTPALGVDILALTRAVAAGTAIATWRIAGALYLDYRVVYLQRRRNATSRRGL
jgi:hypothetical protein